MKSSLKRKFAFAALLPLMMAFAVNGYSQTTPNASNDNADEPLAMVVNNTSSHTGPVIAPPPSGGSSGGMSGDDPPGGDAVDKAFAIQAPTAERPYYYIKYDSNTMAANPGRLPSEQCLPMVDGVDNSDKIVIFNYVAERMGESVLQTKLLHRTLTALSKKGNTQFLLVDVVAYDKQGNGVYNESAAINIMGNTLGKNGANVPYDPNNPQMIVPPYGVVNMPDPDGSGMVRGFDFAAFVSATGKPIPAFVNPETGKVEGDLELLKAHLDAICKKIHITQLAVDKAKAEQVSVDAPANTVASGAAGNITASTTPGLDIP